MSLRVTLVTYDDVPPLGGQGVLVRELRTALERRGLAVATVAGRGPHALAVPRRTGRAPLDLSLALWANPAPVLATAPDVVWAMGGPGGVLLLRRLPVPLVYVANHTYTQAHPWPRPQRLLALAERRAYGLAARVVAISPSTARAVVRLGLPPERVEVLFPGVDVDRYARPRTASPGGRVLFVGRLEAAKGPLDAVRAMRRLRQLRPEMTAAVIGGGRLLEVVRREAHDAVEVLGMVDDERLAEEYARATVVLVPSQYEGLGLVALEAMAAGAVVVGYDVEGLRDAVAENGVLVDPSAGVDGLVEACCRVLADGELRSRLGLAGREHVRRRHSWDAVARRFEAVLRAAVDGHG